MSRKGRDLALILGLAAAVVVGWLWLLRGRDHREWAGVDESVVAEVARQHGRDAAPLLDWVKGDLLLFAFLLAGLGAGLLIGLNAHLLRRRGGPPA
jgi:hypothetical protein